MADTLGVLNPLTYRGYVYDHERNSQLLHGDIQRSLGSPAVKYICADKGVILLMLRRVFCHIVAILIIGTILFMLINGAFSFELINPSFFDYLTFLMCFVGLPVVGVVLSWRWRILRVYLVIAVSILLVIVSIVCIYQTETVSQDLTDYLVGDSEFNYIGSMVLPNAANLTTGEKTSYLHKKCHNGDELIKLSVCYDQDTHEKMVTNAEAWIAQIRSNESDPWIQVHDHTEEISIEGHLYQGYLISTKGRYYAVAYSSCSDCRSITWIFFTSDDLSYMSIESSLFYLTN